MHRFVAALIAGAAIWSGGCTSGFDTESAFSEEDYLCDAESAAEWQAAVDACRDAFEQDESCLGVISFRGELQAVPVVMDATLDATNFQNLIRTNFTLTRSEVSLVGFAPYFGFELTLDSVGGGMPSDVAWPLVIGATPDAALRHEDGFAQAAMRLSAGSDSADLNFVSGTVDIELQRVNEIAGRFALVGFREGNDIEGCFHAFDPEPTTRLETP
ncbi:MAG: hypothetical protein IPL19_11115 [Sandaracinaceae bacterium]|jgi:hypothetical protein|nr:hypothetical protein [Sandaracinaceae bacterium]MBK7154007.1 hypothetical protein [Sandaracinaceae bacterium]MBK7776477.1 hypothetical protein [Sandaracinaceae bacterium]MBK8408517.1 hypothetical protein [Sandaracinaceae bacterium]MBK8590855.1 hypothetical protein [Sandaracinaceae bacterium]